jgi:hypothetical protein
MKVGDPLQEKSATDDDEGGVLGYLGLACDVCLLANEEECRVECLQAGGDVLLDRLVRLGHDVDSYRGGGRREVSLGSFIEASGEKWAVVVWVVLQFSFVPVEMLLGLAAVIIAPAS